MDADQDIAIIGVRDLDAAFEVGDLLLSDRLRVAVIDGDILVADLFDSATAKTQDIRELARDTQVDVLFQNAVDLGSPVFPAVTRVDDDHRL